MKLTKEQLDQLVRDSVKEYTGLDAEELQDLRTQVERGRQEANTEQRQFTRELVQSNMPRSYESKAAHIIKRDPKNGAGLKYGRYVRVNALSKISGVPAIDIAKSWGDQWLADDIAAMQEKALAAGDFTAGGAIVPDEYVNEIIELLRDTSVVRRAGAREVPMRTGSMTIPRQSGAGTANYLGELENINKSEQTFETVQLTAKKLAALTPISNDLLRESDPAADQIVRDDLAMVMALREDIAFLRGDGTAHEPKGILNRVATSHRFDSAGATLDNVTEDLFKALRLVRAANVPVVRGAWFLSTRSLFGLRKLRDANGQLVFDEEIRRGTLLGFPYYETNQLPENLGGGGNESEVYFQEMTQTILADTLEMQLDIFPGGAYHDGSGVVSGISTDQTVVRAISKHDFALRHPESGSVIEAVTWGV